MRTFLSKIRLGSIAAAVLCFGIFLLVTEVCPSLAKTAVWEDAMGLIILMIMVACIAVSLIITVFLAFLNSEIYLFSPILGNMVLAAYIIVCIGAIIIFGMAFVQTVAEMILRVV